MVSRECVSGEGRRDAHKKIMHIINGLHQGGTETALYRLLVAMQATQYDCSIVVLGGTGYYVQKIEALGFPVHVLAMKKTTFFQAVRHLIALIKAFNPEVVQTWLYHADLIGGLCAKFCGVKTIIWGIRCEGMHLKRMTKWVKKLCAMCSWNVPNYIITNSQSAAQRHIDTGYCAEKMRLIHNGFSSADLVVRSRPLLPVAPIFIGTLARFHPDKGYATLIQAIDQVCALHAHVYFVLCGQGCHDQNPGLKTMLSGIKHRDNVRLIDGVEDVAAYLNRLTLFVLPSKTESFPNSLAEAMLSGLPCIATDVGEVRAILGETGYLVPRDDPQQLALACLAMVNKSHEERQQLGVLARNRIACQYSMAQYVKQMTCIYELCNLCAD